MYKVKKTAFILLSAITALTTSSAFAFETAEEAEQACANKKSTPARFSICIDERLTIAERNYQAWLTSRELDLEEKAKQTGRTAIVHEFKKSNTFYKEFMEAQCRRVFFENQGDKSAADQFRLCKIDQIALRIAQLKLETKRK